MRWVRFLFKIIAAPLVVLLTIVTPIFSFIFCYAVVLLKFASMIGVLISIVLLIIGETLGFAVFLFVSYLISPFGIPIIAEWLIDKMDRLNSSLRFFITN
ncbi:CD1845 family protein [Paenibacillus sp. RS8]|uniref:CD1845 family protein n=1 Tax=Paenibacillus sp. RS8 TaxID=3242681 RepID=UPI0035C05C61